MAGGYWGGGMADVRRQSGGAGGSGYISGHSGCIGIKSETEITPKVSTYSTIEDSYHYSGKIFTNTELTTGSSIAPKAIITPLSELSEQYPIKDISVNIGEMNRKFTPGINDYYILLDKDQVNPIITITPAIENVVIEGGNIQEIETITGETKKEIKVTTSEGVEYIYNLYFYRKPSSDCYLKNIKIGDENIQDFEEQNLRYNVDLPYNAEDKINIQTFKKFPGQIVEGDGDIDITKSSTTQTIKVTSEDGKNSAEYNLTLNKVPSTKLKFLDIKNQDFAKIFKSDKYDYQYKVTSGVVSLDIIAIPYDENAKVTIKGGGYIKEGKNPVIITVSRFGVDDTVYTIVVEKGENLGKQEYDFSATGEYQTFVAPAVGFYKFEAWGARGGYARCQGSLNGYPGKGGYTAGTIKLNEGDTVYIYVGKHGTDASVGRDSQAVWNGGGLGTWDHSDDEASGAGGGATDFRLKSGDWNDKQSLASRIMVAGAGGGASYYCTAGSGGGLYGNNASSAKGGTQTSGYGLGIGQNGSGVGDSDGVGRRPEVATGEDI